MRLGRSVASFSIALFATSSCTSTPEPLGEALVVVDTDVAIPRQVNRLQIEVFRSSGELVDQREVVTPTAADWPVSFSVVIPDGVPEDEVLVRLRAFPEGHGISARELERLSRVAPRNTSVYDSIDQACASAPLLRLNEPLTLRRGATKLTSLLNTAACPRDTVSGSAIARLEIAAGGDYRVEVAASIPDGANGEPGSDTAISLRTDCRFPTTQLVCSSRDGASYLSKLDRLTLSPGTYFVVTGGVDPAPADLTLVATQLDVIQQAPPEPPPLTADPARIEPSPGVTIDRLVAIRLRAGERGRVSVTLRGECFGTSSDPSARKTCVDRGGDLVVAPVEVPTGELTRTPMTQQEWTANAHPTCTIPPRSNGGLLDEEVCVPGGSFILGDTLGLEDLERRSQPEHLRVVEPFLMDKYEVTVGRFREALKRGFAPPTPPLSNNAAFDLNALAGLCTWNQGPAPTERAVNVDRERFPLTCVNWGTARAFCRFIDSDLPEEDQWEYAATAAGKDRETPYPWGTERPTCDRTVYGRTPAITSLCRDRPSGPIAVDDPLLAADVTPLGIVGLAGNVEELTLTPFVPYSDPAWQYAGLRGLVNENDAPLRSARGADWSVGSLFATASTRRAEPVIAQYTNVGFRCARRGR